MKLRTVAEDAPFPRYLVCNADEMEPGTFKDRVLIHADPHMIIEGMIIDGYGAKAEQGIIFIRPEYESAARILEREIEIAKEAGFLGKKILGSEFSMDIVVHRSGGRYICGEVTAQLNALMGKRPNPQQPPPYPTEKGLWGMPTVLQNVETLANIPHIFRNGVEWYKNLAKTETGAGTKLFCVSGRVNKPGCFELPMGVRLSEIIEIHAGGMPAGSEYKACLPGGASTRYLPKESYDIEMDFDPMREVGHRLGTGAIPKNVPCRGHFELNGVLCQRILWLVYALPGRIAIHSRPAPAVGGRGGEGRVYPHASADEQALMEFLLCLCSWSHLTGGEPHYLF
jgi:NADH-quinone oxidoreductase subunit F